MSDFEERVAESLRAGAGSAPDALGLADGARRRARTRRRTSLAAAGVTALAVLAVPVAVVALNDDGGEGPVAGRPTATPTPASPKPFPDGRWETWHGVTVRVPGDWDYGNQSTWCVSNGSVDTFVVDRPDDPVEAIACTPAFGYGVSFQELDTDDGDQPFDWPVVTQTGETWPAGTLVGAHGENGVLVTVAGPDRELVADVLSTVSVYGPVDPHGCSATDDGGPGMAGAGEVPVCRYDAEGRLVQSEKLAGDDAAEAVAAVRAAPESRAWDDCKNGVDEYVVMGVEGDRVEIRYDGNTLCGDRGVFVEGVRHDFTIEVLRWALSPGWAGSLGPDVPRPDPLRRRS